MKLEVKQSREQRELNGGVREEWVGDTWEGTWLLYNIYVYENVLMKHSATPNTYCQV